MRTLLFGAAGFLAITGGVWANPPIAGPNLPAQSAISGAAAAEQGYLQGLAMANRAIGGEQGRAWLNGLLQISMGKPYYAIRHAMGPPYKLHQQKATWSAEYALSPQVRVEFFFNGTAIKPSHGSDANYAVDADSPVVSGKYFLTH